MVRMEGLCHLGALVRDVWGQGLVGRSSVEETEVRAGAPNPPTPGVPNPRPWTSTSPWPVRILAAEQEVRGGRVRETLTVFTANSHRLHYCLSPASCQISGGIRFS